MARRLFFVLALGALFGCQKSCQTTEPSLEPCIAAMDPAAADRSGRAIAVACAPLYDRKSCRKSILAAWQDSVAPADRPHVMVEGCRSAYCPSLSDPKPALCADAAESAPLDQYAAKWRELNRAILEHDLGKEKANRLFSAREEAGKKVDASVDAGPPTRVALQGTNILVDGAKVSDLAASDGGARIEALQAALTPRSNAGDPSVVIDVPVDTPMGTVTRLLETATFAGHRRIAFANAGAPDRRVDQGFARSFSAPWATIEPRDNTATLVSRRGLDTKATAEVETANLAKAVGDLKDKDKVEIVVLVTSCRAPLRLTFPALDAASAQKIPATIGACHP